MRIIARLPQTLTSLDTLESLAAISASDLLRDAEYDYANNTAAFSSPVNLPFLAVEKTAQTRAAAGAPVTYTLTVNNSGFGDATGIELSDPLPIGVTYGGGTLNGSTIQWDVLKIGGITGTAQTQFWGTLTCQTGAVVKSVRDKRPEG
ncbi:MAG: hypothetical protein OHK0052_08970 [Anaerolineales bacterium]